jgi:drug/metabolite transporter (DMT)-like permease
MRHIGVALAAIVSWVTVNLLVRGMQEVWPVNLAGVLGRVLTISILAVWILSTGDGWRRLRPRGFGIALLWMGLVALVLNLLWYNAMRWTTATNAALLFRLDLVFVLLIGTFLGLERIRLPQAGIIAFLLVGLGLFTELNKFELSNHMVGDVMVVGAAFGYAVNAFIIRRILTVMDTLAVSLYNLLASGLGFLMIALVQDEFFLLPSASAKPHAWWWIVALGLATAVSLPLYYAALRRMPVWKLRAWMLLAPVLVAIVEWCIWGIAISPMQLCGALMLLTGLAVLIYEERLQPAIDQS